MSLDEACCQDIFSHLVTNGAVFGFVACDKNTTEVTPAVLYHMGVLGINNLSINGKKCRQIL